MWPSRRAIGSRRPTLAQEQQALLWQLHAILPHLLPQMSTLPRHPLREVERIIAANVMAARCQFEGLTTDEIADYQAELAVQLMVRAEEERKGEKKVEGEEEGKRELGSIPSHYLVHYELGPGGPLRLRTSPILCF